MNKEAEISQLTAAVRHVQAEAGTSTIEVNQAKEDIVGLANSRDLIVDNIMDIQEKLDKMGSLGSGGGSGSRRTIMASTSVS